MPLDKEARAVLDLLESQGRPPLNEQTLEESRKASVAFSKIVGGKPVKVNRAEDRTIPGPAGQIPVRIYYPATGGPFPALVYFHGGGFVRGNLETHDNVCRHLCKDAKCVVIAVDYRLAPENKFPAAPEDCYAALRWVQEQGESIGVDPSRIAVAGDSAGGNLATVVCIMAKDRETPQPIFQLLVYPCTDHYSRNLPSMKQNGEGYLLTAEMIRWFAEQYLNGPQDFDNPYAHPLRARDLSDLPPALVITAEYDPLLDEGELYARLMEEDGVPVEVSRYDGTIHAFYNMSGVMEQARAALAESAAALRAAFTR